MLNNHGYDVFQTAVEHGYIDTSLWELLNETQQKDLMHSKWFYFFDKDTKLKIIDN